MKQLFKIILCVALIVNIATFADDGMNQYKEDTDNIWRTGAGSEDSAFTAISLSMLGWGVALTVAIAVLTGVLHQSTASTSHSKGSHCH